LPTNFFCRAILLSPVTPISYHSSIPATPQTPKALPLDRFHIEGEIDYTRIQTAFAEARELALKQSWLRQPDDKFQPGTVRAARCDRYLHVLADMTDEDIVLAADPARKSHIQVGDVFQIFVERPEKGDYLEIHITPDTRIRAFVWTPELLEKFRAGEESLDSILLDETPAPEGATWIRKDNGSWTAYLKIPLALLGKPSPGESPGDSYKMVFCRFDASKELETPVISSTADFPSRPLFHEKKFWHTCVFP